MNTTLLHHGTAAKRTSKGSGVLQQHPLRRKVKQVQRSLGKTPSIELAKTKATMYLDCSGFSQSFEPHKGFLPQDFEYVCPAFSFTIPLDAAHGPDFTPAVSCMRRDHLSLHPLRPQCWSSAGSNACTAPSCTCSLQGTIGG